MHCVHEGDERCAHGARREEEWSWASTPRVAWETKGSSANNAAAAVNRSVT